MPSAIRKSVLVKLRTPGLWAPIGWFSLGVAFTFLAFAVTGETTQPWVTWILAVLGCSIGVVGAAVAMVATTRLQLAGSVQSHSVEPVSSSPAPPAAETLPTRGQSFPTEGRIVNPGRRQAREPQRAPGQAMGPAAVQPRTEPPVEPLATAEPSFYGGTSAREEEAYYQPSQRAAVRQHSVDRSRPPMHSAESPPAVAAARHTSSLEDALVAVWQNFKSDGRFTARGLHRQLQAAGLECPVYEGRQLGGDENILGVAADESGEDVFLLPSFTCSHSALSPWFEYQGQAARTARVQVVQQLAILAQEGGAYQLRQKGIVR